MPKKRVAKNVCALCLHPKRDAIEKFMQEGHTYKKLVAEFRLRSISQYTVSRHRNRHMLAQDSIATTRKRTFLDDADILFETPESVENCVADIKQLVMLSKEFATLARAALRTGATRDAIAALSQVRACQESIAKYRLEKSKAPHELQKPVFHITFREPGERDTNRLLHVVHDNLQTITKKYGETILDEDGKPIFEKEFKLIGYIGHKYREFLKAHPEIEPAPPCRAQCRVRSPSTRKRKQSRSRT